MNIVLIVLDTLRADHVGAYGNPWIKTPALDRLAQESAVFTRAYNGAIPTIPVRRTLHTGLRTFPFKGHRKTPGIVIPVLGWQPVPEGQVTVAEMLQRRGYLTGLITDTAPYLEPGMNFHRGFEQYVFFQGQDGGGGGSAAYGKRIGIDRFLTERMRGRREERLLTRYWAVASQWESEEQFFPARVFGAAMCWLQENDGVEPFFLLVDSFDPHEPWYVPKQYAELYDPGYRGTEMIMPLYGPATYLTEQELANMRARYAANVTFVDAWLGRFLEALRAKGLLDKTLVIVTSDHGHLLGEHGVTGKLPQALYPELTHVPLIVRHPHGHGAGKRFDAFVGDHDVVPTILSAANLEPPYPLEGQPLQRLVDGTAKHRDHALTAMGSIRGTFVWVCDGQYALIVRANGEQARLFRVTDDPGHFHDLAKDRMNVVRRLYELALADAGGTIYKAVEDIKPGAVPYAGA